MKKKKLQAKLSSTKKKLAKAESKVSDLKSKLALTETTRATPRKTKASSARPSVRKAGIAKKTDR